MNTKLIIFGTISLVMWVAITFISFGLPYNVCVFIDNATFHIASDAVFDMANGFYYYVDNNNMPTHVFLLLFFINFSLYFLLVLRLDKKVSSANTLAIIVFFSISFRVALLPSVLIHENDIYRYIWDGKTFSSGVNPFKYAPVEIEEENYSLYTVEDAQEVQRLVYNKNDNPSFFRKIGHKQVPTIYPPFMQVLFAFTVLISKNSILLMKFLFVFFDLGVLGLIILMLKHFKKDVSYCLVYGWSPLVIREISNAGHYDSVTIFFLMLSLYMLVISKKHLSAVMLSVSALCKYFPAVLFPIFIRRKKQVVLFSLMFMVPFIPFFFWGKVGVNGVFEGLLTYSREWSYNGLVYSVIYALLDRFLPQFTQTLIPTKLVLGGIFAVVLGNVYLRPSDEVRDIVWNVFVVIAALFLLSPVGDPWYYCWLMPFLCFFPKRSFILLSGLLALSYLNFRADIYFLNEYYLGIPAVTLLVYVPFVLSLVYYWTKRRGEINV